MRGILTIVWALLVAALGWATVNWKATAIQKDILARSIEAVKPLNANAEVLVDGRFVTVRGPEPTEDSKAKTLAAANDVYGALGPTDGLWVPVVSNVLEFFSAEKRSDGSLTLTGLVPSDDAKAAAEAAVKAAFTGAINNQLVVSGGGDPVSKLPNLGDALKALSGLEIGSLTATAERVRLSGVAATQAAADAAAALQTAAPNLVQAFVQGPPAIAASKIGQLESQISSLTSELDTAKKAAADAQAASNKRIDELLAQLAPAQPAAPAPAPAAPASDEETLTRCNTAVAGLLQGARVEFDTGKASIRPEGLALISRLLAAAQPCLNNPALRATVGGHTDSRGDEADNLKLSQERADAVKSVLAARGIDANDITAIGFGESMPIADNTTEEGQQANRRITIEWSLR